MERRICEKTKVAGYSWASTWIESNTSTTGTHQLCSHASRTHGIFHIWLLDEHLLKPPLERLIFLHILKRENKGNVRAAAVLSDAIKSIVC